LGRSKRASRLSARLTHSKIRKIGDGSGVDQIVILQISCDLAHPRVVRRIIRTGHFGTMTMRKTILFTTALLATISAMPASAQAPAGRAVSYQGLDLNSRAGRSALNRRIATAVESVCGSYAGASSDETREIDRCRAAARTGIESQLAALQSRNARMAFSR
jgi:UrcA family protein